MKLLLLTKLNKKTKTMKHLNNKEKYFFEINKDQYNLFYFNLKDKNGNIYLKSGSYTQKTNCLKGIRSIIRNSKNDARVIVEQTRDEKWKGSLKAENGKTRAFKTAFNTKEEVKNFIEDLKSLTLETHVVDNTKIKN